MSSGSIGLAPALLINAKTKFPAYEDTGVSYPAETIDVKENVTRFDLAGFIELGAHYELLEKVWLNCTLTGQYSFTTLSNDDYFSDNKIKHYGFTILFGVKYRL